MAATMIGLRINNYEIASLLGEGGVGQVYLANHFLLERRVAIKLLKPNLTVDGSVVARFFNEARAANAIRHPNVVGILDAGTLEDGQPYIMMEHLQGESLSARLRGQGRLAWPQVRDIAEQVARGLTVAHELGIIHRDLKPENIFLCTEGELPGRERVKILDFGIAKLRDEFSRSRIHTGDALLGSPLYMAPEQCRGLSEQIDGRTDVYALGAVMYHMLCGSPPFTSEAWGDILVMHVARAPEPLSQREPTVLPEVEAAVLRALAKQPDDRFPTISAFLQALPDVTGAVTIDVGHASLRSPVIGRSPADADGWRRRLGAQSAWRTMLAVGVALGLAWAPSPLHPTTLGELCYQPLQSSGPLELPAPDPPPLLADHFVPCLRPAIAAACRCPDPAATTRPRPATPTRTVARDEPKRSPAPARARPLELKKW